VRFYGFLAVLTEDTEGPWLEGQKPQADNDA
jgi:hypothetical protein